MNITEKTSVVGGLSKEQLLIWLNESPKTSDWDAIVVYNRGRANALLMQQYIKKLTAANYLKPIDGQIEGPEGSKLNFYGIQLGIPRLTFENADIENSKARVTQAITAGLAIMNSEPVGGYKGIHSIMRPNGAAGPTLWMDVHLKDAPGGVTDVGEVILDLKEMDDFDTDLFSDQVSVINAKEFFLKRFQENPELQVYQLGTLNKATDSTLTPQSFAVRTQAAPGAKSRGAPNYGDGAVVMFVTLKGGTNGGMPTKDSDFKYLIPNDENGTKYSSAVLLSNRVLLAKIIKPGLDEKLPQAKFIIASATDDTGKPLHSWLQATEGEVRWESFRFESEHAGGESTLVSKAPIIFEMKKGEFSGLSLKAKENTLNISWYHTATTPFHQHVAIGGGANDHENDGDVVLELKANFNMTPVIDPDSFNIEFILEDDLSSGGSMPFLDWTTFLGFDDTSDLYHALTVKLDETVGTLLKVVVLPDIDTFLLRNLLFPDQNSMTLTDAHVPGDLAIFGNVDPSLSSFVITPEAPVMSVGAALKFTTDPIVTDVQWSVKGLPGGTGPIGAFSTNGDGTYTAPNVTDMDGREAQQVIVTATGTTKRNTQASCSAVVSIVSHPISVNPLFKVAGPGTSLELTAGTTDERTLNWALKDPGQGGGLSPATGKICTYTASPVSGTAMFTLEVIQVTDDQGNMGQADILIINKALGGQVTVDLANAALGKAQLQFEVMYDDGPIEVPSNYLTWTLLAGTGSVDPQGMYTEPQQQEPGFAIVTCAFLIDNPPFPPKTEYGYTVLPLPLDAYPDMIKSYR